MVLQANLNCPVGIVLIASALFAMLGYVAASYATQWFLVRLAMGLLLGAIPILYVFRKKQKRMKLFTEQLPEAMEMLARSLKAGHAFTGGLQMVGQEFGDPLGTEFSKTLDEINFGVAYEDALRNLSSRIDSDDLKLFVISVIIQRTSGGNLAEILENIGRLIRERFKLRGNVQTLTAEGRISAYILLAMPLFIGYVLYLINPGYVGVLFTDPIGPYLLGATGVMMMIGAFVMKRMVDIKV
jgi:tight adherence protein B